MHSRQLTPLDRLLAGANNALRTVAAPAGRPARDNPATDVAEADLTSDEKAHAAGLMRVNHSGEVAAQALYQGHAAVARNKLIEAQMQQAANEEFDHLAWCEQRLAELGESPSRLSPVYEPPGSATRPWSWKLTGTTSSSTRSGGKGRHP